jgi:tRNA threonylcarbamoyladenosine biosynthesis protein TsaE
MVTATSKFVSRSPEETLEWGAQLAKKLKPPRVIALEGELGAGKTLLAKGIARGLQMSPKNVVSSPTFTLINEYAGRCPIYHMDLYRIETAEEFCELGYEDYFYGKGITLVEWAERIKELLPPDALRIRLKVIGPNEREIECSSSE